MSSALEFPQECVLLGSNDRVKWTRILTLTTVAATASASVARRFPAFSVYRLVIARGSSGGNGRARLFGTQFRGWVLQNDVVADAIAAAAAGETGVMGPPGEGADAAATMPGEPGERGMPGEPGFARPPTEEEMNAAAAAAAMGMAGTPGNMGMSGDPGPIAAEPTPEELVAAASAVVGAEGPSGPTGRTDFARGVSIPPPPPQTVVALTVTAAAFQEEEAVVVDEVAGIISRACVANMELPGAGNFWIQLPDLRLLLPSTAPPLTSTATLRSVSLAITNGDKSSLFTVVFAPGQTLAEDSSLLPDELAKWHICAESIAVEDRALVIRVTAQWQGESTLHLVLPDSPSAAPAMVAFPAP